MSSEVTHVFHMEMTCGGCTGAAERVLKKNYGDKISKIVCSLEDKTVTVTSDVSSDDLMEALKKTGKEITYKGQA